MKENIEDKFQKFNQEQKRVRATTASGHRSAMQFTSDSNLYDAIKEAKVGAYAETKSNL